MRTTLTIDPEVAAKAKRTVARTGVPFKTVINQAFRTGLDQFLAPRPSKPYQTNPKPMGLRPGLSYNNISELLSLTEGNRHQ